MDLYSKHLTANITGQYDRSFLHRRAVQQSLSVLPVRLGRDRTDVERSDVEVMTHLQHHAGPVVDVGQAHYSYNNRDSLSTRGGGRGRELVPVRLYMMNSSVV